MTIIHDFSVNSFTQYSFYKRGQQRNTYIEVLRHRKHIHDEDRKKNEGIDAKIN